MANQLPYAIREAIIQVCGKAFWYRDPLRAFLLAAGVPAALYDRYAQDATSKYVIVRHVLGELDSRDDEGWLVQRRILTELCKLRKIPDEGVADKDAALGALRELKELAVSQKLFAEEEKSASALRLEEANRRQAALAARAKKVEDLRTTYAAMVTSRDDPQARGYGLEDLLAELFELHEIAYRRPYRTPTEQIDGHFEFKGFDYLVEARWRKELPTEADLVTFERKVDKKLSSTRGLFVSIIGFRIEALLEFTKGHASSSVVLMCGQDLTLILEGFVSLVDAMDIKVQKAAQEGIIYFPLSRRFGS